MDFNKLIERYTAQSATAKKEMAHNLSEDILDIINEGGECTIETTDAETTKPDPAAEAAKPKPKLPLTSLSSFPEYMPEEENPAILIKGRWLERGGSAWWISTAGTGKSIASLQLAFLWTEGLPFAGLTPNAPHLNIWIVQSEDSPSRITIDREDIIEELTEKHPDINWRKTAEKIKFLKIQGVGSDFLDKLDSVLDQTLRDDTEQMPDLIIFNPFLAYIGGPVTDGAFVTPFLRGGEINRKTTKGLQPILEKYDIAVLIFHHTPKPPTEKEVDAWVKSPFPEYQGAGSSDITNWGRSFITMMRVKDHPNMVMLTAGKNGGDLGWDEIDGAKRRYLAYSGKPGITGKARHAWRELTDEEFAEVTSAAVQEEKSNEQILADALKDEPMTYAQVKEFGKQSGMSKNKCEAAWKVVSSAPAKYGLVCLAAHRPGTRTKVWFYGLEDAVKTAVWNYETEGEND